MAWKACLLALPIIMVSACSSIPPGLHRVDGHLRECPKSPNCVNSEAGAGIAAIKPIPYEGSAEAAMQRIRQRMEKMGGHVELAEPDYLWVTFRSRFLRFIDDVEVRPDDAAKVLHLRSGSRLGYSDFGKNRERVERIRDHWQEAVKP